MIDYFPNLNCLRHTNEGINRNFTTDGLTIKPRIDIKYLSISLAYGPNIISFSTLLNWVQDKFPKLHKFEFPYPCTFAFSLQDDVANSLLNYIYDMRDYKIHVTGKIDMISKYCAMPANRKR
jgi:hypothetical protein